jgi:hypothetical protein
LGCALEHLDTQSAQGLVAMKGLVQVRCGDDHGSTSTCIDGLCGLDHIAIPAGGFKVDRADVLVSLTTLALLRAPIICTLPENRL